MGRINCETPCLYIYIYMCVCVCVCVCIKYIGFVNEESVSGILKLARDNFWHTFKSFQVY